jgi:subtilisin family serine protease
VRKLLLFASLICLSLPSFGQQRLSTALKQELTLMGDREVVRIQIVMEEKADLDALRQQLAATRLSTSQRAQRVAQELSAHASRTQAPILDIIKQFSLQHPNGTGNSRSLWVRNMVTVDASKDLILLLAQHPSIAIMDLDARWMLSPIELPRMEAAAGSRAVGGVEPGLMAIGARFMWNLGYTGRNRIGYTLDTGVWPEHPALRDHFLYFNYPIARTWFAYDLRFPGDKSSSHGSHVTGTMMGLDAATADTIGVAFNARFIASDPVVSNLAFLKPLTDFMYAFQWAIDPDGDPNTLDDVPDVINNSWGFDPPADTLVCESVVADVLTAVELAGIANVFAAGNDGPDVSTIGTPNYINTGLVNTFTVGAVNGNASNFPIADFSSRGPSVCGGEGSLAIKPEVSAPGVNVRSSIENGEYALYSGTSMASPHTAGAVLLLKEAFPMATGEEIMLALYYSAMDMGDVGEDNTYGMGMINLEAAFNHLSQTFTPEPPVSAAWDLAVEVVSPSLTVTCSTGITTTLRLHNRGQQPITSADIIYGQVGQPDQTQTWSGTITPGTYTDVTLPALTLAGNGFTELWFRAALTNDEIELDRHNNSTVLRFDRRSEESLPFAENFETVTLNDDRWLVDNPDGLLTWDTLAVDGPNWSTISAHMDFFRYTPKQSQLDGLISPLLAVSDVALPTALRFDLYYTLFHPNYADTLSVLVSTDCGQNWATVYQKGGADLATHDDDGSNRLPESINEWRTEYVDLSNLAGQTALVKFQTLNRKGNHLLLDNILIYTGPEPEGIDDVVMQELSVYPNPGSDNYRLSGWKDGMQLTYTVVDAYGKVMRNGVLNSPEISLQGLASGMYMLRLEQAQTVRTLRIVKMK